MTEGGKWTRLELLSRSAAATVLGERASWLARWLDRLLPTVDVQIEELRYFLDEQDQQPRGFVRA